METYFNIDAVSKNGLKSRCRCNTSGTIQLNGDGASGEVPIVHMDEKVNDRNIIDLVGGYQDFGKHSEAFKSSHKTNCICLNMQQASLAFP